MFPKTFCISIICSFICCAALAQEPPTITPCGEQRVCLSETTYVLCVVITADPAFPYPIDSFQIEWGDTRVTTIPGTLTPDNQFHEYDVSDFYDNCAFETSIDIGLLTYVSELPDPLFNGSRMWFRNPPQAHFSFEMDTICVGDTAVMINNSCPENSILTHEWDYGDNLQGTANSHPYPLGGSYVVSLTVENICGSNRITDILEVIPEPMAMAEPTAGVLEGQERFIVCLGGGGTVTLSAAGSENADSYEWGPNNPGYSWLQQDEVETTITFTQAGTFDITLTVNNPCDRSSQATVTFEVIDDDLLAIAPQPDVCAGIYYTPAPFFDDAVYSITRANGGTVSFDTFPVFLDAFDTYTVSASLENACGLQEVADEFSIAPPVEVAITSPGQNTSVCKGSSRIPLSASLIGGTWLGAHIEQDGNSTFFNPTAEGAFEIIYQFGEGPCAGRDTVVFTVQGVTVTVDDINVCPGSGPVQLTGSQPGGDWSSSECPSCISGDQFIVGNMGSLLSVAISYTITNSLGCSSTAQATVSVLAPNAQFAIPGPYCSNAPLDVNAAGAAGDTLIWRINGDAVPPPPFANLTAGLNTIELIAVIGACREAASQEILVLNPPPGAGFQIDQSRICPGDSVTFTPTDDLNLSDSLAMPLSFSWNFSRNDNDIATTYIPPNPVVFENDTDNTLSYSVIFSIFNECDTVMQDTTIAVSALPVADIGVDSTKTGCSPLTVVITNRASGEPDDCRWNIDGVPPFMGCRDTFTHTFYAEGNTVDYLVALAVANECGEDTAEETITVIPPGVKAFYNADDPDFVVCPFDTVCFEDASTPTPMLWAWNSNGIPFSNDPNPCLVFGVPNDTFQVSLKVSTGCGYDTIKHTIITTAAPAVDFELPPFGCIGQPVENIVNRTSPDLYAYIWDLGNGQLDSTHFTPAPVYGTGNRSYTLKLTVTDFPNLCQNSLEKELYIRENPVADFLLSDTIGCEGQLLQGEAINISQNANQWIWKYGDFPVSESELLNYSFQKVGRQDITLVATYDGACADSLAKTISVIDCQVYAPTAFSPNGDGINDFFTLYSGQGMARNINRLVIFDRWGNLVFDRSDFPPTLDRNVDPNGWDGTLDGKRLDPAVFAYYAEVEFTGGRVEKFHGEVTLVGGE